MISPSTQRIIVRWLHLILAIPIVGYIYGPFDQLPDYAPTVRYVAFPVMLLSGLWMWKGQWLRRLFGKRSQQSEAAA